MPKPLLRKVGPRATGLGYLTGITCTPDGAWAVAGMLNTEVVFVALQGEPRVESIPHCGIVAALSSDGRYLASGIDERVFLSNAATGGSIRRYGGHDNAALAIAFSPDGSCFAVGGKYELVVHPTDKDGGKFLPVGGNTVDSVAFLDGGATLLVGGTSGLLAMWDVASGKETGRLPGHTGRVRGLAISSDGRRAATGADDRSVRLWDLALRAQVAQFEGVGSVHSVAFSADERLVLVGSDIGTLSALDLESGERASDTFGPTEHPLMPYGPHVAAIPGTGKVVTGDVAGNVVVWEVAESA